MGQARRLGLVKDRLRLKDATHIIANMAVLSTIRLVAEARDQLLDALRPFAPQRVAEEEGRAEAIRLGTEDVKDEERLLQRVTHLRAVLLWADEVPGQDLFHQQPDQVQQRLGTALALAHKILAPWSPARRRRNLARMLAFLWLRLCRYKAMSVAWGAPGGGQTI